jgi:DNA polymerase delta subunit 1
MIENAPSIGDRVAQIMISGTKEPKKIVNADDPNSVLEPFLPIDIDYYLEE